MLSENKITNGTFDTSDGWSTDEAGLFYISDGYATAAPGAGTEDAILSQELTGISAGDKCLVTFTCSVYDLAEPAAFDVSLMGTSMQQTINTSGTFTETIVAGEEGSNLTFTLAADGTGSTITIDNVSVQKITTAILTDVEAWAIEKLIALDNDAGEPMFKNIEDQDGTFTQKANAEKCVDHYTGQLGAELASAIASFNKYCPFAFVKSEIVRVDREGDFDANLSIALTIMIGQSSNTRGVCRIGDDNRPGTNRMMEKLILAFDRKHPNSDGYDVSCDDFYLNDILAVINSAKKSGVYLEFLAPWITIN